MPHFIIEYAAPLTSEIDPQTLVDSAHQAGVESGLFIPSHIKVRAYPVEHFLTAGAPTPFVHVNILLLPGRDDPTRKALAQQMLDAMAQHLADDVTISVETNELHQATYVKRENET